MNQEKSMDKGLFTGLEDACSGESENQIYLAARIFRDADPSDLTSIVARAEILPSGLACRPIINGRKEILEYCSSFNCIGRDPLGGLYIGENDGYLTYHAGRVVFHDCMEIAPRLVVNRSIYVRGDGRITIGTGSGKVVDINCEAFRQFEIIPDYGYSYINSIHGIGENFMVAVGARGAIARFTSGRWEKISPPANVNFDTVWCKSQNEIYVGGEDGFAWRWNGDGLWQPLYAPENTDQSNASSFAEFNGVLYGAFGFRGIFRLSGDTFTQVPESKGAVIAKLRVTTAGLIGLGTGLTDYSNWFMCFDGNQWRKERVTISI